MQTTKFYSLTEDDVEVETVTAFAAAAMWWNEKPEERVVYEMSLTQRDKFDQPIRLGSVSVSLPLKESISLQSQEAYQNQQTGNQAPHSAGTDRGLSRRCTRPCNR